MLIQLNTPESFRHNVHYDEDANWCGGRGHAKIRTTFVGIFGKKVITNSTHGQFLSHDHDYCVNNPRKQSTKSLRTKLKNALKRLILEGALN